MSEALFAVDDKIVDPSNGFVRYPVYLNKMKQRIEIVFNSEESASEFDFLVHAPYAGKDEIGKYSLPQPRYYIMYYKDAQVLCTNLRDLLIQIVSHTEPDVYCIFNVTSGKILKQAEMVEKSLQSTKQNE